MTKHTFHLVLKLQALHVVHVSVAVEQISLKCRSRPLLTNKNRQLVFKNEQVNTAKMYSSVTDTSHKTANNAITIKMQKRLVYSP